MPMLTRSLFAAAVAACLTLSDAGLPHARGQQTHKLPGLKPRIGFQPFSPDGKLLVVQTGHVGMKHSDSVSLTIWDVAKEQILTTLVETDESRGCRPVAFSPDGKTLADDNHDGGVTLWDVATWKEKQKLPPPSVERISPSRLVFSPDGRFLVQAYHHVVGRRPPKARWSMRIWDCQRSRERVTIDLDGRLHHNLRFSPDGKSLVGALTVELKKRGQDSRVAGEVQLWDMTTFKRQKRLQGFGTWDLKRGRIAQNLGLPLGVSGYELALSPDAKLLVTTHLDKIAIWDVGTGASRLLGSHPVAVHVVAFSSDGRTLATMVDDFGDGIVKLWDLKTGRLLANLKHGQQRTWVDGVAFSPDGSFLATASVRRDLLYLWKLPVDSRSVPRPVPIGVQLPR